jgi:hypothetical protein
MKSRKGETVFDTDEHVRGDVTTEGLGKLRAVFKKDGSVTAGNASGINDGAAAVVLAEAGAAAAAGVEPMGRLVSYGFAGVDPMIMGEGPIPAVKIALDRAGLSVGDLDVIESNEAFAAQALAVCKGLDFDPAKTNPNGGAVALGRRDPDREVPLRAQAHRWQVRPGHDVHRWWPGHRRGLRARLKPAYDSPFPGRLIKTGVEPRGSTPVSFRVLQRKSASISAR